MKAWKLMPLVVIAAGLLAYQNSFTGSYFHDDFGSIPENPSIRQLWPIWQCLSPPHRNWLTVEGRPLINLSLAINYALGGYNVWGYHAFNLTVHILAGLTLLGIVRRTLLTPTLVPGFGAAANELALAVAVLWTVHPLQTEAVTYIIQRAESLVGLFYLLTVYCFIRGVESVPLRRAVGTRSTASMAALERSPTGEAALPSALWFTLSVLACALGMATKEVMASAPLIVMLYDRAFLSGSFREVWQRRRPLYLALACTWAVLALVDVSAGILGYASMTARHINPWQYLATQPGVILYYLRLSVWPSPLVLDRPWPLASTWMGIVPPAVVIVILLGASVWAWRRRPVWGFMGAWFFLILAPSSSFVPSLNAIYDHRMYLSLAAVVSVVVMGLYSVAGRRSLAVFVVVAVALGFLTWQHNQNYQRHPEYSLGLALQRAGRTQEAIGHYEQALRVAPNDVEGHYNLGTALYEVGRVSEAIEHYEWALRLRPDSLETHDNLASALLVVGKVPEAIDHYEQALRLKPDDAVTHFDLGIALEQVNNLNEAIAQYEEAVRIRPEFAEAHSNLGSALLELGKVQEAIEHFEQALQIKPDFAGAHNNLGNALLGTGNTQDAIRHYEQALQINPDLAEVQNNLGAALERAGRSQEAIAHYEQAVRIQPDFPAAQSSLARLRPAR